MKAPNNKKKVMAGLSGSSNKEGTNMKASAMMGTHFGFSISPVTNGRFCVRLMVLSLSRSQY